MLSVPYTIQDGRRHLNFEDPAQQRLYDTLFGLSQPGSIGFDITDPAHLHRLGIWDSKRNTVDYPFRFTDKGMVERSLRMFRYERIDGYLREDRSICRALGGGAVAPEEHQRRCRERAEDMAEVYIRRYLPQMADSRLVWLDPREEREEYNILLRSGLNGFTLTVDSAPKASRGAGLFGRWKR